MEGKDDTIKWLCEDVFIDEDGSLNAYDYLYWKIGEETACIDGRFNSQQLRAIAEYMEKKSRKGV